MRTPHTNPQLNPPAYRLTCVYCKHAPATHLLVADLRIPAGRERVTSLVCLHCGAGSVADARSIARSPASVWLFMLAEEPDTLPEKTISW